MASKNYVLLEATYATRKVHELWRETALEMSPYLKVSSFVY